ncbi:MAG TPA: hypothetical protein VMQ93_09160 [Novosphingobium sp.]|nr:hypothetical protein [Novosphingobium sp.]
MDGLTARIFTQTPTLLIGLVVLVLLWGSMQVGILIRRRRLRAAPDGQEDDSTHEGYIVSGALGLLALLLGFTFALAVDRYDSRRALVLEEANAIGTTYLRAQLLDEPYRSQLSATLRDYTGNRLALAQAQGVDAQRPLLEQSDELQQRLWTQTVAAIRPIRGLEVSSTFVDAMNLTIDEGAARVAARRAHVPPRVLVALLVYMLISALILGYVMSRSPRRTATAVLLALVTLSYLLILDIDRPTGGGIREPQAPMEDLLAMMQRSPPPSFGTIVR